MVPVGIVPFPLLWAGLIAALLLWPFLFYKYRRSASVHEPGSSPLDQEGPEVFKPVQSGTTKAFEPLPASGAAPAAAAPQPVTVAPKPSLAKTVGQVAPKAAAAPAPNPTPAPASAPAPIPAPAQAQSAAPAQLVVKKAAPAAAGATMTGAATTGGISPAVVYLQNLKGQMEALKKEVDGMKVLLSNVAQKSEAQLNTVLQRLEAMQARERQTPPAEVKAKPEPKAAPTAEPPEISEPKPAPQVTAPESTVTLSVPEPKVQPAAAEPLPAPEPEQPPVADPPRRRGPVWPV